MNCRMTEMFITNRSVKMNEQTKQYIGILCDIIVVFFIVFAIWFLFRDIRYDGTGDADITRELDSIRTEQQRAAESIERIESGLDDSIGAIGSIEQSNSNAQNTVDRIEESNSSIKTAIDRVERGNRESQAIIADNQQRIGACKQVLCEIQRRAEENSK